MMVLRKSPDCQIDISEATEKEIINEYKFIVSLKSKLIRVKYQKSVGK